MSALSGKPKATTLPDHYHLGIAITDRDTILNYYRYYPDRAYDILSDGKVLLKSLEQRNAPAQIVSLPLVRNYHTIGGPLIVRARVNKSIVAMLKQQDLDVMRIDRVSTNESEMHPVDWYFTPAYAKAFRDGVNMLFATPKPQRARR
ncbi:hypothetical protein [Spirosoma sordidisoli]|uniref:Uncharacterized protein n=1 Tax=Spirosoma sordidisoli TaxID=2502893 RepID=A0A4Q2UKC8_9BACT|nr:hypothetical protein [Spirosoma sordidisoli]RYC69734.1 hypothetical protein EQG79_14155 [Spirosoma sordidisoli]